MPIHACEYRAVSTVDIEASRVLFGENHSRQGACHATSMHAPATINLRTLTTPNFKFQILKTKLEDDTVSALRGIITTFTARFFPIFFLKINKKNETS